MDGVVDPQTADEIERQFPTKVLRSNFCEDLALADGTNAATDGRLRCKVRLTNPDDSKDTYSGWVDLVILQGTGPHPLIGWQATKRLKWRLMDDHVWIQGSSGNTKVPLLSASEVLQHEDGLQAVAAMQLASVAHIRETLARDMDFNGALSEREESGF
jgi:hypothetical protein